MSAKREEWLKERSKGLGGSDASAVIGQNPYKTNVELWEEKTGRRISEDIGDKPYVQYGNNAEKPLIELFALDFPEYEVIHKDFDHRVHPEYDFIRGSLDGELIEKETGRKGVLEIKTTNILQSMQREKWKDGVPQNYFIQVLHYLLVTGYEFAILKAQLKSVYREEGILLTTKHYFIDRKDVEEDIEYIKQSEIEFWRLVESDTRPNTIIPEF